MHNATTTTAKSAKSTTTAKATSALKSRTEATDRKEVISAFDKIKRNAMRGRVDAQIAYCKITALAVLKQIETGFRKESDGPTDLSANDLKIIQGLRSDIMSLNNIDRVRSLLDSAKTEHTDADGNVKISINGDLEKKALALLEDLANRPGLAVLDQAYLVFLEERQKAKKRHAGKEWLDEPYTETSYKRSVYGLAKPRPVEKETTAARKIKSAIRNEIRQNRSLSIDGSGKYVSLEDVFTDEDGNEVNIIRLLSAKVYGCNDYNNPETAWIVSTDTSLDDVEYLKRAMRIMRKELSEMEFTVLKYRLEGMDNGQILDAINAERSKNGQKLVTKDQVKTYRKRIRAKYEQLKSKIAG